MAVFRVSPNPTTKQRLFVVAIVFWSATLTAGFMLAADRDTRPASSGDVVLAWPTSTTIERSADRANVLVFTHPQCPCTRATLRELERIVARSGELASFQVVMCVPEGAPSDFARGDLWDQACAITGVRVSARAAADARAFGARTSGEVLVYGASGHLRFHGGITASRGHEGDNAGRDAVIACLREGQAPNPGETPVFGCALFDEESSGVFP